MRHRKMWLNIRAIAMFLAAIAAPGLAGAQSAPPPTCPVTDSNVKVIRVPHREVVVMPMSSDGPTQDDIQIFTSVPAGMNFHVTHIGAASHPAPPLGVRSTATRWSCSSLAAR